MNRTQVINTESELASAIADPNIDVIHIPCELEITQDHDLANKEVVVAPRVLTFNGGSFQNYLGISEQKVDLQFSQADLPPDTSGEFPWRDLQASRFAIDGLEPAYTPHESILQHLYMPNRTEVYVDHAENIRLNGNLILANQDPANGVSTTPEEVVIKAAIAMLNGRTQDRLNTGLSGQFTNGTIIIGAGLYNVSSRIFWPARLGLMGLDGRDRPNQFGSNLQAVAGGDLTTDDYLIHQVFSDGRNSNGSFNTHFAQFGINLDGICNGMRAGGAQCSSFRDITVRRAANLAFLSLGQRPADFTNVELVTLDGPCFRSIGRSRITMTACSFTNDEGENTLEFTNNDAIILLSPIFENTFDRLIDFQGLVGSLFCRGAYMKEVGDTSGGQTVELLRTNSDEMEIDFGGSVRVAGPTTYNWTHDGVTELLRNTPSGALEFPIRAIHQSATTTI